MPLIEMSQIRAEVVAPHRTANIRVRQKKLTEIGIEREPIHTCT